MIDITGYEDLYAVTEEGRVWSKPRKWIGSNHSVHTSYGHWLAEQKHKRGYRFYVLCINGKARNHLTHRLVARAFIPNPNDLPEVNHKDCDKTNNNVSNLEWISSRANYDHAIANGRFRCLTRNTARGERHSNAKLTENDVLELRHLHDFGFGARILADVYGIGKTTASHVIRRENWTHI